MAIKKVIILEKKEGETSLQALEDFRAKNPKYQWQKMTYAGRLDPLASGLMLVLAGEARHEKEKYLKLPKEYKFEILFGFGTDTYDILGKVVVPKTVIGDSPMTVFGEDEELGERIKRNLKFFRGKFQQKYPMYSSRTVAGKPLFTYARAGVDVESPEREARVMKLEYLGMKKISPKMLLRNIERRIAKVEGDFRQKEILKIWRKKLKNKKYSLPVVKFRIKCGSGTYVRAIANDFGNQIGVPALAFVIRRTKIGKWSQAE